MLLGLMFFGVTPLSVTSLNAVSQSLMVPSDHDATLSMLNVTCGLYYTPMTIIIDDPWVINKLEASLTDNARLKCDSATWF
jgi:hypothetical protein